ncbi:MAG: acylphosphatase [Fimbriimonadales bacterium]|nr:acylphosphatase [Fimbriimonadales bacterium]
MKRLVARVYGIVQGVGYRVFTQSAAVQKGLQGYVRNCPDGSVEVVAEGDESLLKQFLETLQRGPVGARVEHIEATYSEATGEYAGFVIRR